MLKQTFSLDRNLWSSSFCSRYRLGAEARGWSCHLPLSLEERIDHDRKIALHYQDERKDSSEFAGSTEKYLPSLRSQARRCHLN